MNLASHRQREREMVKKGWLRLLLTILLLPGWLVPVNAQADQASSVRPGDDPAVRFSDVPAVRFSDLPAAHWAYEAVQSGVERGYITGFADGTFRPDAPVSVAEFLKMTFMTLTEVQEDGRIWWAEKYLDMIPEWFRGGWNAGTTSFGQGTPWYKNYVDTAKNLGIIHDEYDGRYHEPLTRERAAKIIANLDTPFRGQYQREYSMIAGTQLFKDFDQVDFYLQEYVGNVALRGIMVGSNGYFKPKSTITRAEAAKICLLLADDSLRTKVNVNLDGIPYSIVPNPGYGTMVYIFANDEMKRVYDEMYRRQKDYPGATDAYVGDLSYYENFALKEKGFRKIYFLDLINDPTVAIDFRIGFSENVYNISIATTEGRMERASKEIYHFLSLIFEKQNAGLVFNKLNSIVWAARKGNNEVFEDTFGGRQMVIVSYGDFISVGISAYNDKK